MDELAGRYLTLCLRLSRLVPGAVEWYAGPDRLLAAVHSEPRRLPDRLASEAERLAADVATEATLPIDRADWLTAQLVSIGTTGRARAGEVLAFPEHLRRTLGVTMDTFDDDRADRALATVDAAVGGTGPIRDRMARYLDDRALPADRVVDVFARAVQLLRAAAQAAFRLPDDEYVEVRPGDAGDVLAEARPDGRSATKVTVSPRPATLTEVFAAAARTTYPGAHTVRVLRNALLVEQFGRGECTLELRTSPGRVAAVGAAAIGTRALLAPHERELLLDQLADGEGLRLDARVELAVHDALLDLDEAVPAAGADLHVGRSSQARACLDRYLLRPEVPVRGALTDLADRDVATAAHVAPIGRRLALGFLAKQDDPVAAYRRLVTEQLTPAALAAGR